MHTNEFLVGIPLYPPPHFKLTFLTGWGMGRGGVIKNVEKCLHPPFRSNGEDQFSLFFFPFLATKVFPRPHSIYWEQWDKRGCSLCTFQSFLLCRRCLRP